MGDIYGLDLHDAGEALLRAAEAACRNETDDGLESTFATHVAGPFLLTRQLRERLEESADGRIIWVSSGGMYTRRLNLEDLDWTEREYDGVTAYAETKRAQVVLAELWSEELAGSSVVVEGLLWCG